MQGSMGTGKDCWEPLGTITILVTRGDSLLSGDLDGTTSPMRMVCYRKKEKREEARALGVSQGDFWKVLLN